ncbi:MAG: smalltalk protein [Bacteroidaceae bacterium]|nr:smalltalk protein [Bacteroidaceae bacterium]
MSKKVSINWNIIIQAVLAAITSIASAITLNSCINWPL